MAAFFGAEEIWNGHAAGDDTEPVILAGVYQSNGGEYESEREFRHSLKELSELAKACHMDPVHTLTQQLSQIDRALYVGSGKAEEIAVFVKEMEAQRVIFNDTLSPSQIRNLQKCLKVPVVDRTRLILDIFEQRARTKEARLQVELAKLQYLKPRLTGLWETQNRQGGASGAQSSKGEGEKQLELDRRTIDMRLSELRRELKAVIRERETRRKKRRNSSLPLVALVGYTNAGKSTIMNALISAYASDELSEKKNVFEADMLFATLDTTIRRITPEKGRDFLLSDTVGFIRHLPTFLIEAFRSTLEEVTEADLLLQVVDASDEYACKHVEVTKETIADLHAGHIPMVTVFNKADLCDPALEHPRRGRRESSVDEEQNENIYISAREPDSIKLLVSVILEKLERKNLSREFLIPYDKGQVQAYLMQNARIDTLDYRADGIFIKANCTAAVSEKADRMLRCRG